MIPLPLPHILSQFQSLHQVLAVFSMGFFLAGLWELGGCALYYKIDGVKDRKGVITGLALWIFGLVNMFLGLYLWLPVALGAMIFLIVQSTKILAKGI